MSFIRHFISGSTIFGGGLPNMLVLGTGQSLIANWSSTTNDMTAAGETSFEATCNNYTPNNFVNAGNGSSALLRSTCISYQPSGLSDQNDYWIDDCGYYAPGTLPYNASTNPTGVKSYFRGETATLPVAGARYTDIDAILAANGQAKSGVLYILWSQGETEAPVIAGYNYLTQAQYYAGMIWLKDKFFTDFSQLRKFYIRPIGRRYRASNDDGYEAIRKSQRDLAAAYPTQVKMGCDAYDLELHNDVLISTYTATASQTTFAIPFTPASNYRANVFVDGVEKNAADPDVFTDFSVVGSNIVFNSGLSAGQVVTHYPYDNVHRSNTSNGVEARRAAYECLGNEGLFSGNTSGATITSAAYSNPVINLTVTHDKGTSLKTTGSAYSSSPITVSSSNGLYPFRLLDGSGANIAVSQVQITGASTVSITPDQSILMPNNTIQWGYGSMVGTPISACVLDNDSVNPLPLRSSASSGIAFNGTTTLAPTTSLVQAADAQILSTATTGNSSALGTNIVAGASMVFCQGLSVPDNTPTQRSLYALARAMHSKASVTRYATSATDSGIPNITWKMQLAQFPDSIIDFAYTIDVSIPSGATTSGAITLPIAVTPSRSFFFQDTDASTEVFSNTRGNERYVVEPITDGTTVTITAPIATLSGISIVGRVWVVQLKAAAVKTIQSIDITVAAASASNTQAITTVTLANSVFFGTGLVQLSGTADNAPSRRLFRVTSAASLFTATRNTASSSQAFRITGYNVELNAGYWSVQSYSNATVTLTDSSVLQSITSVAQNKTFIIRNGHTSTATSNTANRDHTCYIGPVVSGSNYTGFYIKRGTSATTTTTTQNSQFVTFLV